MSIWASQISILQDYFLVQIEIPFYICLVITINSDGEGRGKITNITLYFIKVWNINGNILKCYSNPAANKAVAVQV